MEGAVDHGRGPVSDTVGARESERASETADACASWGMTRGSRVHPT